MTGALIINVAMKDSIHITYESDAAVIEISNKMEEIEQEKRRARHDESFKKTKCKSQQRRRMLRQVTKPMPWREGVQLFSRQGKIQRMERTLESGIGKPCESEEGKMQGRASPMMSCQVLKRQAMSFKVNTAVGADGLHSRIPLDLPDDLFGVVVIFQLWDRWVSFEQLLVVTSRTAQTVNVFCLSETNCVSLVCCVLCLGPEEAEKWSVGGGEVLAGGRLPQCRKQRKKHRLGKETIPT